MLKAAGIDRAISVLACVDSDAENIFTCLTARELRSDITIVARASVEDSEKKLLRAGADRVISPYKSSGAEMARLALQPQVTGVVDVAPEYRMEEIDVAEGCQAAGRTIGEVRGTTTIAAVRSDDGEVHPQPSSDTVLRPGDVVVAMGTVGALQGARAALRPVANEPVRDGARGSGIDRFAIRSRPQAAAPRKSLRASPSAPKWSGLVAACAASSAEASCSSSSSVEPGSIGSLPALRAAGGRAGRAASRAGPPRPGSRSRLAELVGDDRHQRPDDERDRAADPADGGAAHLALCERGLVERRGGQVEAHADARRSTRSARS